MDDARSICLFSAVFLLANVAEVHCGGNVTKMSVTPTVVRETETITFTCTALVGDFPTIHFHKSFGNWSWHVFVNDDDEDVLERMPESERQRYKVNSKLNHTEPATLTNTYIINDARNADSGTYSCKTSISEKSVNVSVVADAKNISMYLDDEPIRASSGGGNLSTMERKYVRLNAKYRLNCTVSGGNPFPEVSLRSDAGGVPQPSALSTAFQREGAFLANVSKNATLTVDEWTVDIGYIGKPLRCVGGVAPNSEALSIGFIPVTNHTEPMFDCNDTAHVASNTDSVQHTCRVFSHPADLTSAKITWHTPDQTPIEIATPGQSIGRGDHEYTLHEDGHYKMIVNSPKHDVNDHWWTISLNIEMIRSRSTFPGNGIFDFVVVNPSGTAMHMVEITFDEPVGGGVSREMYASVSGLLALVITASLIARRQ